MAAALEKLAERRYLDDRRFADAFARSRLAHYGLGRNRIRADLSRRGVKRSDAEKAVAAALADHPESELVDAQARRFWASRAADPAPVRVRKLWAFLVRRGFPASLVHDRLRALWPRWSDALEGLEPADPDDR